MLPTVPLALCNHEWMGVGMHAVRTSTVMRDRDTNRSTGDLLLEELIESNIGKHRSRGSQKEVTDEDQPHKVCTCKNDGERHPKLRVQKNRQTSIMKDNEAPRMEKQDALRARCIRYIRSTPSRELGHDVMI